jgi:hypothetical protein
MLKTIKASIDKDGNVHLDERISLKSTKKALVTILDEENTPADITMVSEESLRNEWDNPEEDKAWAHLQ